MAGRPPSEDIDFKTRNPEGPPPGEKDKMEMVVFRCSEQSLADGDLIDGNMKKIFELLDGYRSLSSIAFATGMSMSEFQKAVKALIALGLIEPVETGKMLAD